MSALGVDPGDDGDAGEPDPEPDGADSRQALMRQEAEHEQGVEDRHRGLHDSGETGVDVLLAPRDQPERQGGIENAEDAEAVPPRAAQLAEGRCS